MSKLPKLVPSDWGPLVISVIATAALLASSGTLVALMHRLHWNDLMAWLQPVAIDVLAGYAVWLWLTSKRPEVVSLSRLVSLCCLGVSLVGNGLEHVLAALQVALPAWSVGVLAAGFGVVPPLAFFVAVHLRATAAGQLAKRKPARVSTEVDKPVDEQPAPEPEVSGGKRTGTDDQVLAWIAGQPVTPTKRQVMAHWAIGNSRALSLLKRAA